MNKLTWPAVGLIAVLGGVVVALGTLTSFGSGEIIAVLGVLGGIGGGAAVVGELRAETTAQTTQLTAIEKRVNGELDGRIAAAVDKGNADLLDILRQQGLIR